MPDQPSGTVTFLFADIEDSTRLLHQLGDRYAHVVEEYRRLLREAFHEVGGYEPDTAGESFFVVFPHAPDAVRAALAAQRTVSTSPWPDGVTLRVRMGLHTGRPILAGGGYIGLDVHRAARIASIGWGGQILVSQATHDAVMHDLPADASVRDLGEHRLKDLQRREQIFQLLHPELPADFPPLRSLDMLPHNLPHQLSSFVGREREMAQLRELLSTTSLLTLVGPGGMGKTRLALQVAADVLEKFPNGVWLVELAAISDAAQIPRAVASAVGVREEGECSLLTTLADYLQRKKLLLILDNCEYPAEACAQFVDPILQSCPNVKIMAVGWRPLGVAAEVIYSLPPLSLPDSHHLLSVEQLIQTESVRLFVERAVTAQPALTLTETNAPVVTQLCHQLDGMPLAIELAAARVKVLSVDQIAARLVDRFKLLTGGSRTAPPRQQSLRATIDWGYGLLSEQERILLRRLAVFAGRWTVEAAKAICAGEEVDGSDVPDLLTHLVSKSLIVMEGRGQDARYRLLETVRQYAQERLQESGETAAVEARHRDWSLRVVSNA